MNKNKSKPSAAGSIIDRRNKMSESGVSDLSQLDAHIAQTILKKKLTKHNSLEHRTR